MGLFGESSAVEELRRQQDKHQHILDTLQRDINEIKTMVKEGSASNVDNAKLISNVIGKLEAIQTHLSKTDIQINNDNKQFGDQHNSGGAQASQLNQGDMKK